MQNDEQLHPGHRSIRLPTRDYSAQGVYFLTICSHEKRCIFGQILNERMELNPLGNLVRECWLAIPDHFPRTNLHDFVVMPNHLHGIIEIVPPTGAQRAVPPQGAVSKPGVVRGSLGAIVRSFKSAVTKRAREEMQWNGEFWQRNYFERVLRDGQELADAGAYIAENTKQWASAQAGAQHAAPLQTRLGR